MSFSRSPSIKYQLLRVFLLNPPCSMSSYRHRGVFRLGCSKSRPSRGLDEDTSTWTGKEAAERASSSSALGGRADGGM